ncbi:MAG: flagellar biosynthesis protein FlhF [Planctomycetota bacterium]
MTEVRTFRARTMQEAMDVVRREFGPEAVILHTRETAASKIWPWSKRAAEVEVTAGRGVSVVSRSEAARVPVASPAAVAIPFTIGEIPFAPVRITPPLETPRVPRSPANRQPTIQGLTGNSSATAVMPRSFAPAASSAVASMPVAGLASQAEMAQQVLSLQTLLQQLTARLEPDRAEVPPELFSVYTRLIDAEVPEETARQLITRLKREFPQANWSDATQAPALLSGLVERDLRCTGAIRTIPNRRKVVALVGPTGVGKTTTIAKLAANFKLRAGLRVGLVTVDTYRIAAVDQLRTYAEIIDIPMKVVSGPRDMSRVLNELSDMDLVLIDTAGRSPADELQLQELKNLLAEGPVDEVHLVLSLAASTRSLVNTARQFAGVRTSSMILTKLDESPGLGQLLAALPELPFPISYLTTGQNVPDDIEPAVAARLARLVLGMETLRV